MDHTIIKEAATKIVANIKAMEDDITVLRNKQDIISTSDTTMTGSYPGRLSIEEIGGKCEQFTTTGKSLVDFTKGKTSTNSGVTYTLQPDGSFKRTGTATTDVGNVWMLGNWSLEPNDDTTLITLEAGKHYYVVDCVVFSNQAVIYASDNVLYVDPNKYPEDGFKVTGIRNTFFEIGKTYNDTIYPIICEMSEGPEWEPYTGGQPSPNPDYPQEIKKTVVSEIKTHGKNFLDCIEVSEKTENGIQFTPVFDDGKLQYVELNGTSTAEATLRLNSNVNLDTSEKYILSDSASTSVTKYCTQLYNSDGLYLPNSADNATFVPRDVTYIARILVRSGVTLDHVRFYPMIRKEGTDPTYEPYTESTITLSQPIELYGIGDVQDTIEDGKVVRRFANTVFDGSDDELWQYEADSARTCTDLLGTRIKKPLNNDSKINLLCDHLPNKTATETYLGNMGISVQSNGGRVYIYPGNGMYLITWKSHLQSSPMTVVYELATPAIEDLPIADQAALNSLKTFSDITYVEFDSEIEPTFKGEYGVTKIGGYTLEGILAGANGVSLGQSNTDRITALEATLVNNI